MVPKEQITYAVTLTGALFGAGGITLLISAVFGLSAPAPVIYTFFIMVFMVVGIFLYFIAPVLFITAYVRPEWFGIFDLNKAFNRYGLIWIFGLVVCCVLLVFVGPNLNLPDLSAAGGPILAVCMFLSVTTVLASWVSPVFILRTKQTQHRVLAAVGVLAFVGMLASVLI